jgi:hypothetical protein
MLQVSEIYIYPIKSCRGIAVSSADVEARGLAGDRRYMLVDAKGRFLTQREHARMALVHVLSEEGGYRIGAPGQPSLHLPERLQAGTDCGVRIWRDNVQAVLAPEEFNIWFSQFMGFACGLVYMGDHDHRPVPNDSAQFDDEVSFADAAPLLLLSQGSLTDLNGRLARPVTMRQFRPNIVVDTEIPFAEDGWNAVSVGGAEFAVAWPCSRCILTTIDPETGVKDAGGEPLETLKSYRRVGPRVMFGQNLIPRRHGAIRVGDSVNVL